jgi:hypothetical protein
MKTFNSHFENHTKNLRFSPKKSENRPTLVYTRRTNMQYLPLLGSLFKFLIIILLWKFTHVELRGNICLLWLCDIFGLQRCLSFLVFMTWFLRTLLGFLRVFCFVLWFLALFCLGVHPWPPSPTHLW